MGFLRQATKFADILPADIQGNSDRAPPSKERSCPVSLEFRRSELKDQEHKFELGETVYFTSRPLGHMASNGTYQIVRLLPSDGDDYQYRIKSAAEAFERVAKESQLDTSR
jgi:hypothetical protein